MTLADTAATSGNQISVNAPFNSGAVWRSEKQAAGQGFTTSYTFSVGQTTTGFASDLFQFSVQNFASDGTYSGSTSGLGTPITANHFTIVLDTFQNPWDTSNWHFDVASTDAAGVYTEIVNNVTIAGGKDTNQHTIDIEYDAVATTLEVYFDSILYVNLVYDLSSGIDLDNGNAWVGFIAAGNGDEPHLLNSWSFVPEPSSAVLLGFGLAALGKRRRMEAA